MAASEGDGGRGGELDSLFEGMVVIDSSDLLPPSSYPSSSVPQPPSSEAEIASSSASVSSSLPLDEDLFSDLTILAPLSLDQQPAVSVPSSDTPARNLQAIPADLSPSSTPETPPLLQPSRSIPRKKKKAIRIGYARETGGVNQAEEHPVFEKSIGSFSNVVPLPAIEVIVVDENSRAAEDSRNDAGGIAEKTEEDHRPSESRSKDVEEKQETIESPAEKEDTEEDPVSVVERKLENIKIQISGKLAEIKKTVANLSEERKILRLKRRNAADSVNAVSTKFKGLERELEEACEMEDFERAEILSESLAATEKEKDDQLKLLRIAEEDCDAVDLKMQELLEIQISTEEESIDLLEKFSQDAGDNAEKIKNHTSEICSREMEEWQESMETLESRRLEIEIESNIVNEASSGILSHIDQLTEADKREKEALTNRGAILERELEELQELIKQKESQISENNLQIQQVEERISKVVSEFEESESTIIERRRFLQTGLSEIESKNKDLSRKKKEIEESLMIADKKSLRLKELSEISVVEAKICRDMVELRKNMASDVMKVREAKIRLAKMEEERSQEVQILRQQISVARSSLQELSSTRARIQEETTMLTQRIGFIDKKVPELEAEKKAAATARNFKEAARASAEAKTLNIERETAQLEKNKKVNDLEKVNEEIKDIAREMEEREELVLMREKEAAVAGWERLCLVAATARAELAAAIDSEETEEWKMLQAEVEAAESKATQLRERYGFGLESVKTTSKCLMSLPAIISLSGLDASERKNG